MAMVGRCLLPVATAMILSGCASQQSMTREESINATQNEYEGVTEEEFYQAAERLFKLSDEDDTRFSYQGEHAMRVQRDWSLYLVLAAARGTHTWQIQTEPSSDNLKASVHVSTGGAGMSGAPTGGGGAAPITTPMSSSMINSPAVYGLFWSRMDYLLGKSPEWYTCDEWEAKIDSGETYGIMEPLCLALNTDDLIPEGPIR